jgi:hypothetical protein
MVLNNRKIMTLLFGNPAKAKQMWIMDFNRIDESEKDLEMREMVKTYHVKPGGIHFEEREQKRVA